MGREYDDNQTLQQKIMIGANKLADNVASTLGPRGRNVLLQESGKTPFITKDGVTVAHFVALEDAFENAAVSVIRQAAIETNNVAGDGTTTSTVLARAVLNESQKFLASGVSPIELQRGLSLAAKCVGDNLLRAATPVRNIQDIEHIATISANNDSTIGKLVALAYDKVGQDGSITIEESRSLETSLDISEGFKLDSGFCASAFVTDDRRSIMHHEDPLFLVTDHKISAVEQVLPVLEMIARDGRPLVIVADDIEGQALAAMIMNAMRGTLKIAAIKAPHYGEERASALSDLAVSTGAVLITRESGIKLSEVQLSHLGTSKFIESSKSGTVIVGGNCDAEEVDKRIDSLKSQIEDLDNLQEAELIQKRIVRLASGVAVISVGGATEVEVIEKKHRIEDALEAVRAAQAQGIVPGGGVALLKASETIIIATNGDDGHSDQGVGATVIRAACQEPIRQMAINAGDSPDLVIDSVKNAKDGYGWDFRKGGLVNLLESGIIDPAKVTRTALLNAVSCAGTLITTNFGIIQTEDK
ncbi:MAG: molecular chaperone GroEL [Proteobacteria bacterium]|jgi:chaperonin GroEL|nr:molecular chaperone GroEL [Pseudomonadota bacterium]